MSCNIFQNHVVVYIIITCVQGMKLPFEAIEIQKHIHMPLD